MASDTTNTVVCLEKRDDSKDTTVVWMRLKFRMKPYGELMRVHKPAGYLCISFPYLMGSLWTACVEKESAVQWPQIIKTCCIMLLIGSLLRSLSCSFNDIVDADLDRQVARCRSRPMARGAISNKDAYMFCAMQTTVLLVCLLLFTNARTSAIFIPALPLHGLYPFFKRFSNYPQVFLGLTLSYGTLVGVSSISQNVAGLISQDNLKMSFIFLFASYFIWTVIHDTVYAFQDLEDDKASGIMSMAVRYSHHPTLLLLSLSVTQVICNFAIGFFLKASFRYYAPACFGVAIMLITMLLDLDVTDADRCAFWFKHGSLTFGVLVCTGLLLQYSG